MFYKKNNIKKKFTLLIIFSIITILFISGSGSTYLKTPLLKSDRIVSETRLKSSGYWILVGTTININANWAAINSSNDWCNGAGTIGDPYIIENVTIDAQNSGSCIRVQNSVDHFIIRNCTLIDGGTSSFDSGIYLNNVQNGLIENNTCYDSRIGIMLGSSSNIIVRDNVVYSSSFVGIYIYYGSSNDAINNKITGSGRGLSIFSSSNINFSQNQLINSGIHVYYNSESNLITNHIDTSNTVSGKPIYYIVNEDDLDNSNFTNPGQIILVSCDNAQISGFNFNDTNVGLQLLYCDNAEIFGNNFSSISQNGIMVRNGDFNNITSNNFEATSTAMELSDSCLNNTVDDNTVFNSYNALYVYLNSENNTIINNNFTQCTLGMYISTCGYNLYENNNIINSVSRGIHFSSSVDNGKLVNNTIDGSSTYGIRLDTNIDSIMFQKNIIKNSGTAGVYISTSDCEHNIFFQNSFLQNVKHVIDDGTNNNYNNSLIGNYWDNYTGIDANDDGIGDTPHPIEGSAMTFDYLPIYDDGDSIGPIITITSPSMGSYHSQSPTIDLTITDPSGVNDTWYTIIGSGSYHFITGSSFIVNMTSWMNENDGSVIIRVYGNDTLGNLGYSDITVYKDTVAPVIIINDPTNESTFSIAPEFDIDITDDNLDTVWYTMDGSDFIITVFTGTFDITTWNALPDGVINITFYAEDLAGNNG
ncbi:MAG: hypothetical protein EU552_02525, partial [Promethearchaeota archaeon]